MPDQAESGQSEGPRGAVREVRATAGPLLPGAVVRAAAAPKERRRGEGAYEALLVLCGSAGSLKTR